MQLMCSGTRLLMAGYFEMKLLYFFFFGRKRYADMNPFLQNHYIFLLKRFVYKIIEGGNCSTSISKSSFLQ